MLLCLLSDSFLLGRLENFYINQLVAKAQSELWQQEDRADALLADAAKASSENIFQKQQRLYELSRKDGIYLYIYENQSLSFWTSNSVFPNHLPLKGFSALQKLSNGYYLQKALAGR